VFSQLSFEPTFEKIEAHFFRKFFQVTLKNSYFEFGVEIEKRAPLEFLFVLSYLLQKFE
jgi:hypothetical protein